MKIIAAFKTHFDIGFTKLPSEILKKYSGEMLDDVIEVCEKTYPLGRGRMFVWTMPSWPLKKIFEDAKGEKLQKAEELVRRGQLVPHALPFTTQTEALDRSELNYGCKIAKEFCKEHGIKAPVSAKMTDVPGHTSGLIDVLIANDIKFVHFGCNGASHPPKVPTLFWWEDLSGKRVLVMYSALYGTSVLPPKEWKYPVWLAMQQTVDNKGPQGAEIIEQLERETEGKAELYVGTMDDFYYEISKCDLSDLPVLRGEMGDTWIHGLATYPKEVGMVREAENTILAIKDEIDIKDGKTRKLLEKYYENALLFGEHTFGLDSKITLGEKRRYDKEGFNSERKEPRFIRIEKSWNEKREYAEIAAIAANELAKACNYEKLKPISDANSPYSADFEDGKVVISCPNGKKVAIDFVYKLISSWQMIEYQRYYLARFCHWAIADFGRDDLPDYDGAEFFGVSPVVQKKGKDLVVTLKSEKSSYEEYGNAESVTITATCESDRVFIRLSLNNKHATPLLEAGNLYFDVDTKGDSYLVTKCGQEINPETDIIEGANTKLFAVEKYAAIDDVAINAIHSPLCTFGGNGVFERNFDKFQKPARKCVVFNLFNNQWGTNFPLYNEGDFTFDFEITNIKTAREIMRLAKTNDLVL